MGVPGDTLQLLGAATIIRLGGHFPGSSVLHWSEGCERAGILCTGRDAVSSSTQHTACICRLTITKHKPPTPA